jgi:hypothetical protein
MSAIARTTVSSTGFITGLYVVLTPLFALVLFRQRIPPAIGIAVPVAVAGLALLGGVEVAVEVRGFERNDERIGALLGCWRRRRTLYQAASYGVAVQPPVFDR